MKVSELLRRARARIEDPAHWTQGTVARDNIGIPVRPRSRDARCWCALGAVDAVTPPRHSRLRSVAVMHLNEVAQLWGGRAPFNGIVSLNDMRKHRTVLRVFDRAILRAEQWER